MEAESPEQIKPSCTNNVANDIPSKPKCVDEDGNPIPGRRGRFRERRDPPEDIKMRQKILRVGEDSTEIIYTAGEINLGVERYGEMIIELLPKAFGIARYWF